MGMRRRDSAAARAAGGFSGTSGAPCRATPWRFAKCWRNIWLGALTSATLRADDQRRSDGVDRAPPRAVTGMRGPTTRAAFFEACMCVSLVVPQGRAHEPSPASLLRSCRGGRQHDAGSRATDVAQTALGMQIRQLEEDLGVALLVRHSRGTEPTRAGVLLHERALAILKMVEETRKEVAACERKRARRSDSASRRLSCWRRDPSSP